MNLEQETGDQLSTKIDNLIEEALGQRIMFACLVLHNDGSLGVFTNAETSAVVEILQTGLVALNPE